MINAQEAKLLAETCDVSVNDFIDVNFSKQIREAAELGKHEYIHNMGSELTYTTIRPTVLQQLYINRLKSFGFHARLAFYSVSYVPQGLSDDDGNGPKHRNVGIIVSW